MTKKQQKKEKIGLKKVREFEAVIDKIYKNA